MYYESKGKVGQHLVMSNNNALMMGLTTWTSPRHDKSTKYVGGVFKLLSGDRVWVTRWPFFRQSYIVKSDSSYFGVYLLQQI